MFVVYFSISCALIAYHKVLFFHFFNFENYCVDMKILEWFGNICVILTKKVAPVQVY